MWKGLLRERRSVRLEQSEGPASLSAGRDARYFEPAQASGEDVREGQTFCANTFDMVGRRSQSGRHAEVSCLGRAGLQSVEGQRPAIHIRQRRPEGSGGDTLDENPSTARFGGCGGNRCEVVSDAIADRDPAAALMKLVHGCTSLSWKLVHDRTSFSRKLVHGCTPGPFSLSVLSFFLFLIDKHTACDESQTSCSVEPKILA